MKSPCSVEILLDMTQLDVGGRCNGFEHKAEASFRTPKVLVGGAQINGISREPDSFIDPA